MTKPTTEKMSEKDALYLYATEPGKLIWLETGCPCSGSYLGKHFLARWRDGEIILAPVPDEPPKPVRVSVTGLGEGCLMFCLPESHKGKTHGKYLLEEAATHGGFFVYHLPNGSQMPANAAPMWIEPNGIAFSRVDESVSEYLSILWPAEIEFDPAFLKGE